MRILVVGQGLAGTLISHAALRRSWDCHVVDSGDASASSVAAGMFNPMSFRRIVEVWDAGVHLETMEETYRDLEDLLGEELLHFLPILKVIPNQDYAREWNERARTMPWIEPVRSDAELKSRFPDVALSRGHGYGVVNGGGWVNLPKLIREWRGHLERSGRILTRRWTTAEAGDCLASGWDAIVDCRGCAGAKDPSAGGFDIRANRGEILTLDIEERPGRVPPTSHILNFGKWVLPMDSSRWRLGASYEWDRQDLEPTKETAGFLMDALEQATNENLSIRVMRHEVGLRPVSRDRRPAVGPWPGITGLHAFNGLGTRGVLIGPRWAKSLVDHLEGVSQLPEIVRPERLFPTL